MTASPPPFSLPERLAEKLAPERLAADVAHFGALGLALARERELLEGQRAAALRQEGGIGQQALDRDLEVHRANRQLTALNRYGLDLCLGRMSPADGSAPVYVGRVGFRGSDGEQLLVDWRSPAAAAFFGATTADPQGLASRRRYRWSGDRIIDYWDELLDAEAATDALTLDDQSAFLSTLAGVRTGRMRDVLATLQSDQDAIIRDSARGVLVVDGGPGTGKTVVALHRAAYLLATEPRLQEGRGGVLFVGPSESYLAYVEDVLPSLGEEGVQLCTLADLVEEGAGARVEVDPAVARLKGDARMVRAVAVAVRQRETPPGEPVTITTDWGEVVVRPEVWDEAFDSPESGLTHNEARAQVWESLIELTALSLPAVAARPVLERALRDADELQEALDAAWPLLDGAALVETLLADDRLLARCAPHLSDEERGRLLRPVGSGWTRSDLPLLDAARALIGPVDDEEADARSRAEAEFERIERSLVADALIDADDDGVGLVTMLRSSDVAESLREKRDRMQTGAEQLAGPFGHVVVDEAQELTEAEWAMLVRRCPSRSLTVVGDRAQARLGFAESWGERLTRVGLVAHRVSPLTLNYRTPAEIMAAAEPVIRAALPDANVPESVRSSGIPVGVVSAAAVPSVLEEWVGESADGIAGVITLDPVALAPLGGAVSLGGSSSNDRVRILTPTEAKGLEFDLVVLDRPATWGDGVTGAVDRYVAMTRATQRLVIAE